MIGINLLQHDRTLAHFGFLYEDALEGAERAAAMFASRAFDLVQRERMRISGSVKIDMPVFWGLRPDELDHECLRSPTRHCVYNIDADPAKDQCIFCGDPFERK